MRQHRIVLNAFVKFARVSIKKRVSPLAPTILYPSTEAILNEHRRIHPSSLAQVGTFTSKVDIVKTLGVECWVGMDCSVCCEAFTEEGAHVPRNLDCGHTFCTLCIQQLDSHAPLRQGPKCPECRTVIRFNRRTAASLPKNYKLLELIREQGRERKIPSSAPQQQEERPRHGMMFMGNYFRPIPEMMMYPVQPVHFASFTEDMNRLRITDPTSMPMPMHYPLPSPSPERVPEAVENGRAVTAPNGTLVCKFFQEGTCRYGPHCWFRHTVLNPNASLCRHWMKGQCRMGLNCHYRHGTDRCVPRRLPRRQQERDPAMPGPSGEGVSSQRRPSTVVFVSDGHVTIQRLTQCQRRLEWGHVFNQAGAPPGMTSDSETFFDNFSSYRYITSYPNHVSVRM